jgi:hypothetical protein
MRNKRTMVLEELEPIAKPLGIKLDYVIEETREYLLCNGQAICCNCTSIEGIRQEFFGYVFLREWRERYLGAFDKQTRNHIKQYWYDKDFNQPYLRI